MSYHPKFEKLCADGCGRTFTGTAPARYAPDCRWKHRAPRRKKYVWTPEKDDAVRRFYDPQAKHWNNRKIAAAKAIGWPSWAIQKRATELGLTYPKDRKDWTAEETDFVLDHVGERTANWMAKKLGRSIASVVLKCKRLKISRRVRIGYTLRELELCFGVDHHAIEKWVRDGKLRARKRGTARYQTGDIWSVTDEAILEFIQNYPMDFRLSKVDQFWFMDLMLGGGLVRKALEAAKTDEASDEEEAA